MEDLLVQFKDIIFSAIDPLLKELETRREERELAAYQTRELQNSVDDHEKRIKKLELTRKTT